jgi:hypothetical protein
MDGRNCSEANQSCQRPLRDPCARGRRGGLPWKHAPFSRRDGGVCATLHYALYVTLTAAPPGLADARGCSWDAVGLMPPVFRRDCEGVDAA